MTGVVALIPAYNEAETIGELVDQARPLVQELVVIDDGSSDGTAERIAGSGAWVLRNERNQGKGASLRRGFVEAVGWGAEWVVTLDGDGQHRPEDISRLIAEARRYPGEIVIAARLLDRDRAPWLRRFANGFADFWISWAAGQPIQDTQSGFRIYPVEALRRIDLQALSTSGFAFESELLIQASVCGVAVRGIPVRTLYPRGARPSHYRPLLDTARIARMVAGRLLRTGMHPLGLLRALHLLPVRR